MRYGSVCSGIEAATAAWHPLGWEPAFFSEIEPFPRAVLSHHYPDVPLHGDFTTIQENEYGPIDLLVGGTPCQSFSVAGLRGGLGDDRGNLALEFLRLADRTRPRWVVWENVPGVLSSNGGRDFGSILGGLVELGYGFAYRVLDAQYFGVAQRRRRVFVVGDLGDWRRAAAVLFERHSLQGHPAPRREKGKGTARAAEEGPGASRNQSQPGSLSHWDGPEHPHPTLNQSARGSGGVGSSNQEVFSQRGAYLAPDVSHTLNAGGMGRQDHESETMIAFEGDVARTLSARHDGSPCADRGPNVVAVPFDLAQITSKTNRSRVEDRLPAGTLSKESQMHVAIAFQSSQSGMRTGDTHATLDANNGSRRHNGVMVPVAFTARDYGNDATTNLAPTMRSLSKGADGHQSGAHGLAVAAAMQVRRLTPRECERLQGFPDDYTLIPHRNKAAADGPRYKALGNSMAVPVMRWIGERIQMVENIVKKN